MKAKFTGIADMADGEFQGQYSPIDTVRQINTANGQQVKEEIIEQSIHSYPCDANSSGSRIHRPQ